MGDGPPLTLLVAPIYATPFLSLNLPLGAIEALLIKARLDGLITQVRIR